MNRTTIAILAAAVLVLGAIFVIGQSAGREGRGPGGHGFGGGMHGRGEMMMMRGLDLSDEQKAQVKQIRDAGRSAAEPVREAMKANRDKLDALSAGGFDEAQVSAIAANQGELTARMIVEKERVRSQIFAILTDEQKAKAAEMKGKMRDRGERRGRRGGMGADAAN